MIIFPQIRLCGRLSEGGIVGHRISLIKRVDMWKFRFHMRGICDSSGDNLFKPTYSLPTEVFASSSQYKNANVVNLVFRLSIEKKQNNNVYNHEM